MLKLSVTLCLSVTLWILVGADIEKGASTPLMEAAQEGHIDIVKYLLDRGVCMCPYLA